MAKKRRPENEVVERWTMEDVKIFTNTGMQMMDMHCELHKIYLASDVLTLFEKKVLGYMDYYYRIEVFPERPIRFNKHKGWSGPPSDEGNDATYEFSLGLGTVRSNQMIDISRKTLESRIMESLKDYDPEYKRERQRQFREQENSKWTNKTFIKKVFNDYNERFTLYSHIYPFHGHDLSGVTEMFELGFHNDDEDGFGIHLTLLGITASFYSCTLQKMICKPFLKTHPRHTRDRGESWDIYYKKVQEWEKTHKFERILDTNWILEIGASRYYGFYVNKEFDGGQSRKSINPWRNKFWNLI